MTIIFVSDGAIGPGWTRPDEIARHYFQDDLSVFFERTITIKADIPARTKLQWIFTGPHAGFTVELSSSKVRVTERFYDSSAPYTAGSWPEKITRDEGRPFSGTLRTLTVIADSHLAVRILVNGIELLNEPLLFDITRHQLMYVAPGSNTVSSKLLCCSHKQSPPPSHSKPISPTSTILLTPPRTTMATISLTVKSLTSTAGNIFLILAAT